MSMEADVRQPRRLPSLRGEYKSRWEAPILFRSWLLFKFQVPSFSLVTLRDAIEPIEARSTASLPIPTPITMAYSSRGSRDDTGYCQSHGCQDEVVTRQLPVPNGQPRLQRSKWCVNRTSTVSTRQSGAVH